MNNRSDKTTAGRVDVQRNVQTLLLFEIVESRRDCFDWFILERIGQSKSGNDAYGIFVATFENFFGRHQQAIAFARNLAQFDTEKFGKFLPADVDGAADQVGAATRTALHFTFALPAQLHGDAAENGSFTGADGGTANASGGVGRSPKVGQHANTARFDFRHLRIFVAVHHIFVETFVHQFVDLWLDPGLAEGGKILAGIAIKEQLIVDELVRNVGIVAGDGECVLGQRLRRKIGDGGCERGGTGCAVCELCQLALERHRGIL